MVGRIRAFIIDEKTGKPRAKVAIVISAEVSSSKEAGTDTFTFGILQSDHAGYLSTVIPDHIKPLHLWVSLLADSSVRVDAGATVSSGLPQAVVILKIPTASEALPKRSYPALHEPDNHDREISPYSFARETELHVGQGSCEDFLPNGSPERTFSFTEIMLDAGSPSSDLIPSNTNKPQSLPFSHLRRGALIKYSMEWLPLGHALGEVIYSLPLAPCESVNLAVIDWRREDQATRQEAAGATEELNHNQRRDRAVEETVSTALREWQSGNTVSVGGTVGVSAAGIGASVTAGASWSSTTGGRNLSGETLQSLADSVSQASSLVRNLYSTVIVQSSQTELDSVQTRAVRNHNHCHALTILYYEVLRQYKVITKIATAKDVVLLKRREFSPPLPMTYKTLLAFRHILEDKLLEPRLRSCFDAIVRQEYEEITESGGGGGPNPNPDSPIVYRLWFYISIPRKDEAGFDPDTNIISAVLPCVQRADMIEPSQWFTRGSGELPADGTPSEIQVDPTKDVWNPEINKSVSAPPLKLSDILRVGVSSWIQGDDLHSHGDEWHLGRVRVEYSLIGSEGVRKVLYDSHEPSFGVPAYPLPYYFKTGTRAPWWGPELVTQNEEETTPALPDPLASQRKADSVCAQRLLDHVNSNQAYYRPLTWINIDPNEYAIAFDKIAYESGTLLEYVDFHPIAVFGDYIAFPLTGAADTRSANSLAKELLSSKVDPVQAYVSLPTRGVLAEAKLSTCNACEEIDVTRFWNWTESPCTDEAPNINGVTPGSRARDIDTRPSDLPTPVVNIVNSPAAPDPTGLAAAMNVIGTPNIFRDMSGRQELSSLLQRLTDGTISMAQARREAQQLQAQQQSPNDNTRSAAAGPPTSARELHDNNQVIRSAVAHGDVSEAEGRELISAQSRRAILGSGVSTGPGLTESSSNLPEPDNPLIMPLPDRDRWYQGWVLLYNFDVDSVNLKPEHIERLNQLIRTLNLVATFRIDAVQGRASETGREEHNRDLSEGRGASVRQYFIDHGIGETVLADLPHPPLGSSDPLRVMEGYSEDEVNRSTLIYYHVLIPAQRIPPPPPRRRATVGSLSQEWAIRIVASGTLHGAAGISLADVSIKNCRTGEAGAFALVGLGIGVAAGGSIDNPGWTSFRTLYPVHLGDFDAAVGFYYTLGAEVLIGYSQAFLRMPYIIDGPVELGGWSLVPEPEIEGGGYLDLVELIDAGDRFQDDEPCS